jgi:hypothetical protein
MLREYKGNDKDKWEESKRKSEKRMTQKKEIF